MWEKANETWSVKESYSLWKYITRDKETHTNLQVMSIFLSVMSSAVLRKEGINLTFGEISQQDATLMEKSLQVMLLREDPSTLMNWLNDSNTDVRIVSVIKYILFAEEA